MGQVPPESNQHYGVEWDDQHGDRVKVRIPGMHPMASNDDAYELLMRIFLGQLLQNQQHMEIVTIKVREFGVENG